jgi:type II secretory pathway pseudopilin PulG
MERLTVRQRQRGTSLIEVLVVIVVFLVGILAIVQIFPFGLDSLRTSRAISLANSLARSEVQRLQGSADQLPEAIVPTRALGTAFEILDPGHDPAVLDAPTILPASVREIDGQSRLIIDGTEFGDWTRITGANRVTRILGEGRAVPAPSVINGDLVSPMQLTFAPIRYTRVAGDVAAPGQLLVYSNDLALRPGNLEQGTPLPTQAGDSSEAFFVNGADAEVAGNPYFGEDQIWIARVPDGLGGFLRHSYRIRLTVNVSGPSVPRAVDLVVSATPTLGTLYAEVGNYAVFRVDELLSLSGGVYSPSEYISVLPGTLRIQRQFQQISKALSFSGNDPYQFKSQNFSLGLLVINPLAANVRWRQADGNFGRLRVRADYTVYDWRVIRDEFRVPAGLNPSVKLILNSVKPTNASGPDGRPRRGIGSTDLNDQTLWTPNRVGTVGNESFVLVDVQTGGVIVGNERAAGSSYYLDGTNGVVQFNDADADDTNGLTGRLYVPGPEPLSPWLDAGLVPMSGRTLRALYMGRSEYAVQPLKASASYQVLAAANAGQLGIGQVYPGGLPAVGRPAGWGSANRIYFPAADFGQKVLIGRVRTVAGTIDERDWQISGRETIDGSVVSYIQLPANLEISNTDPVERVRGASLKVRVLWNPDIFTLTGNSIDNFQRFTDWSAQWRKIETETFELGGLR